MQAALWGAVVGLAGAIAARVVGLDRDRSFYPTVLIFIAFYYVLFAAMAGNASAIGVETMIALLFFAVAAVGRRFGSFIVAGGLLAHGAFDLVRPDALHAAGAPSWWPAFCAAADVALAFAAAQSASRPADRVG